MTIGIICFILYILAFHSTLHIAFTMGLTSFISIYLYSGFSTNKSPEIVFNLFFVASIAKSDLSIPIHLLFKEWADFKVVPEPQKQSKTILS